MTTILELAQNMQRGESAPPPIGRLLGFVLKVIEKVIEPGRTVFEMEADERHHDPMGTLHGGIYCDLADAAMGYAYAATRLAGQGTAAHERTPIMQREQPGASLRLRRAAGQVLWRQVVRTKVVSPSTEYLMRRWG
jgi:acyl-coenzyme A thioesterase PaaI-like protein